MQKVLLLLLVILLLYSIIYYNYYNYYILILLLVIHTSTNITFDGDIKKLFKCYSNLSCFPQNYVILELLQLQEQKTNWVNLTFSSAFYRSGNPRCRDRIRLQWRLAFVQLNVYLIPRPHWTCAERYHRITSAFMKVRLYNSSFHENEPVLLSKNWHVDVCWHT